MTHVRILKGRAKGALGYVAGELRPNDYIRKRVVWSNTNRTGRYRVVHIRNLQEVVAPAPKQGELL